MRRQPSAALKVVGSFRGGIVYVRERFQDARLLNWSGRRLEKPADPTIVHLPQRC